MNLDTVGLFLSLYVFPAYQILNSQSCQWYLPYKHRQIMPNESCRLRSAVWHCRMSTPRLTRWECGREAYTVWGGPSVCLSEMLKLSCEVLHPLHAVPVPPLCLSFRVQVASSMFWFLFTSLMALWIVETVLLSRLWEIQFCRHHVWLCFSDVIASNTFAEDHNYTYALELFNAPTVRI